MLKEYGGYIEFERFQGREYHENAIALNSGRHCVEYLIRAKGIEKLHLPYYMCKSVEGICKKLNITIEYYHIDIHFMPVCDDYFCGREYIYIVNYYGQFSNDVLKQLKKKYGNIIVDNVQAFFQKPIEDTDTVYSCRKFFGVPDGGYLYTDAVLVQEFARDSSCKRMEFLFGRFEKTANEFYEQYILNNKRFAMEPLKKMSATTHNILRGIDYERIKNIRTDNYNYLCEYIGEKNMLKPLTVFGAYMYPLYIENGAEVRKKLQLNKIYIPTLWPEVLENHRSSETEYNMAANILPLPVDQRYSREDMKYILNILRGVI